LKYIQMIRSGEACTMHIGEGSKQQC